VTLTMFDSITVSDLPHGADAYLGYVDGEWPTYPQVVAAFPAAYHLSMTVFPGVVADACDCENGDLTVTQAAEWARSRLAAGAYRPVVYMSAATMRAVNAALTSLGVTRPRVRLLSAHYGVGEHICGPSTCGYPQADGTQWTDSAPGLHGSLIDQSLLSAGFFHGPPESTEDVLFVLQINPVPGNVAPLSIPNGVTRLRFYSNLGASVHVSFPGTGKDSDVFTLAYGTPHSIALNGALCVEVYREDEGTNVISVAGY
jgi:hypothetical protein